MALPARSQSKPPLDSVATIPDTDDTARSACCIKSLMSLSTPAPFNSDQRRRVRKLLSSDSIIAWISASLELMATRRSFQVFHAIMVMGPGSPWRSSGPLRKVIRLPVDEPSGRLLCAWSPMVMTTICCQCWTDGRRLKIKRPGHFRTSLMTRWISCARDILGSWASSERSRLHLTQIKGWVWMANHCRAAMAARHWPISACWGPNQVEQSADHRFQDASKSPRSGLGWSRCGSHWSLASPQGHSRHIDTDLSLLFPIDKTCWSHPWPWAKVDFHHRHFYWNHPRDLPYSRWHGACPWNWEGVDLVVSISAHEDRPRFCELQVSAGCNRYRARVHVERW